MVAVSGILVAMMAVHFAGAQPDPSTYYPHITAKQIAGNITATTFVLEQPRCIFNHLVNETDEIWLIVALSSEVPKIKNLTSPQQSPYQWFGKNSSAYMTLKTYSYAYPCLNVSSTEFTLLRVGTETRCISDASRPDCNGPLPGVGPYRVQFLAINSNGVIIAASNWSRDITLIQGKNFDTTDMWPRPRSTGMLVITSILPFLFAILLATLIALLSYKCTDGCGGANNMTIRDPATITRYTSHHTYSQPESKL